MLMIALRLLGTALLLAVPAVAPAQDDAPPPCAAPEFDEFDFWVGTWDLTWDGGSGTNFVERKLQDCVIQENFDGGEFRGMSVSTYDAKAGHWKQTWVDNAGSYLDFTGGRDGERMILSRIAQRPDGPVHQRMVFYDIQDDSLVWDWETSADAGETWELRWRIHYQRRK